MWSWPRHVWPDPTLEIAEWEQAGHLGGLLDKQLLSACPHLCHRAAKEAVKVRRHSDHKHQPGRMARARTPGEDAGNGRGTAVDVR